MTNPKSSDSVLRQDFLRRLDKLWPAIKGSLAEVRKPCIRPKCAACAHGDKHPAFILSFTDKDRRRCMYVPAELVPQLQQALRNDLTPGGAFALLVFFAFALQCMSTVAVVRRETGGWQWPAVQFAYMTGMAYVCAFLANRLLS